MSNERVLNIIQMDCPICGQKHGIEVCESEGVMIIKDEPISFPEISYRCNRSLDKEYFEFVPSTIGSENNLRARNEYRRKHNLLTSDQIIDIRKKYNLTQSDLALILGWGAVTITRFETKSIQSEEYDRTLKQAIADPSFLLASLKEHVEQFEKDRYDQLIINIEKYSSNVVQAEYFIEFEQTTNKFEAFSLFYDEFFYCGSESAVDAGDFFSINRVVNAIKLNVALKERTPPQLFVAV